ncbi:MAG: serine/threonine protein kinase [Deltaproteobacteria bacterium]|nr:serine/threonine protein kinase [Deltaproteobacteria bacterium]
MEGGKCPSCGEVGVVGSPCAAAVCARRGIHRVPMAHADAALATPPHELEAAIGTFVGDFLIVKRLGAGGFGRVLLGLQRPLFELRAAVKILVDSALPAQHREQTLRAFENEARALATLRHPHVVAMLQYGTGPAGPYLAMEHVPGARTLGSVLDARRDKAGLRLAVVGPVMERLMRGLEAAHKVGIIHRDLKPDNVMLETIDGDPWHVKLVDFGLAKRFVESQDTSNVLGTASNIAPEQLTGRGLGPWTDVYAAGLVAAELLIGAPVFRGTQQEIIQRKLDSTFDPLGLPGVAPSLAAWIRRAAAWSADARFPSMTEARAAWREAIAGATESPPTAPPDGPPPVVASSSAPSSAPAIAPAPRTRSRRWVAPLAITLLVGGVALAATATRDPEPATRGVAPTTGAPGGVVAPATAVPLGSPTPAPTAAACEAIAGAWRLETTVTRARRDPRSYARGVYELAVTPDCGADLVKTGWGTVRFAPDALQRGRGALVRGDDGWELALRVTGGGVDFTMALTLVFGDRLAGTWRHTGASFESAGLEGTLAGERAPR